MISLFRKLAATWPARLFFAALALAFVAWGVSGRMNFGSTDPSRIATVNGAPVSAADFDQLFKRELGQVSQRFPDPTQIPQGLRQQVAISVLQQLVTQEALLQEARRMGIAAPEPAVQTAIKAIPAFAGIDGGFDYNTYQRVLQQNGLTPQHFQMQMGTDVIREQVRKAVTAASRPSDLLTGLIFGYLFEQRTADLVNVTFASHAAPPAPSDAVLQRYYTNNLARYTAPEYRHVKIVVLSPATIGRSLPVTDSEMHTWWDAHKSEFQAPEKRSLQVITAAREATATTLANAWRGGASWDAIAASAKKDGATTTTLDNTTKAAIPAPELGEAAFAAALNSVTGPVKEPLGYQVVRVTAVTPAKNPTFDDMRDTVRQRVGEEKAQDLIDARAQKLQDLFAGGSRIDEVPADLGAAGAEGTLDSNGMTPDGNKAPIPVPDNVRGDVIAEAFKAQKSDSVQLTEGPDHVWYAIAVQDITKPAARLFATVRAQVLTDWQAEQVHHATETDAAKLLATIKSGQSIANAAWGSGLQVTRTPPLLRNRPAKGVPQNLIEQIFSLQKGQATMVETPTGFLVASLADIIKPDPKADSSNFDQVRDALAKAIAEDTMMSYAAAVTEAAKPVPNQKVLDRFMQAGAE